MTIMIIGFTACADGTPDVPIVDVTARILSSFSRPNGDSVALGYLTSLIGTPDGSLYVLDCANTTIYQIVNDSIIINNFASRGNGPGELRISTRGTDGSEICANSNYVGISDNSSLRISIFHTDGRFRNSYRIFHTVSDIGMSSNSRVFAVTVLDSPMVHVYDINGTLESTFGVSAVRGGRAYARFRRSKIAVLRDDLIAIASLTWPTIGIYEDGSLSKVIEYSYEEVFSGGSKEEIEFAREMDRTCQEFTPSRVSSVPESSSKGQGTAPPWKLLEFTAAEKRLFGFLGGRVFEIDIATGDIRQVFILSSNEEDSNKRLRYTTGMTVQSGILLVLLPEESAISTAVLWDNR